MIQGAEKSLIRSVTLRQRGRADGQKGTGDHQSLEGVHAWLGVQGIWLVCKRRRPAATKPARPASSSTAEAGSGTGANM